jgi:hypothetical protein
LDCCGKGLASRSGPFCCLDVATFFELAATFTPEDVSDVMEEWPKRFRMNPFPQIDVFEHIQWLNEQVKALELEEPNDDSFVRKFVGKRRPKDNKPPP